MHLVTCARPEEPFEHAPRTALLAEPAESEREGARWEGFWSAQSDDYFVCCTKIDGATEWFRVEDDVVTRHPPEQRVIELRPANRKRVALIIAQSPGGRRMLVGSARRT